MVASTNVFTAGPELPDWPLVVRVSETPPTLSVTEAVPVTVPPELEVKVTVHWPLVLVPDAAQVSVMFVVVAPLALVRVTAGFTPPTGCGPLPEPSSALTVTVKVWLSPMPFVALGPIAMVASPFAYTTLFRSPDWPLVVRVSETPPTLSVTEAVPVTVPPELEVKVTVHWPLALVPVEAQVSVMFVAVAPLVLARVTVGFTALTGCGPLPEPSLALTVTAKV